MAKYHLSVGLVAVLSSGKSLKLSHRHLKMQLESNPPEKVRLFLSVPKTFRLSCQNVFINSSSHVPVASPHHGRCGELSHAYSQHIRCIKALKINTEVVSEALQMKKVSDSGNTDSFPATASPPFSSLHYQPSIHLSIHPSIHPHLISALSEQRGLFVSPACV